ncbi:PDZ domain-containing protein [Haloferula sp.]|uniref:PDZ domain-containing protein n=1 Tax=Haloferula sp. TaxID=2497595 RepID=UPI00329E9F8C
MRGLLPWLLLPLFSVSLTAEEAIPEVLLTLPEVEKEDRPNHSKPWVGLDVAPLDEVTRAHASDVPEGVGFLVKSVSKGGPARAAGLRRYDILWKFEDQLLVNAAQFATLLKLQKVGDTVKMSVVRSGSQIELELVLGEVPAEPELAGISAADLPLIPNGVPGMPQVRVTPQERTAEMTKADGSTAKLVYKDGEPHVTIMDAEQKVIYDGPVREDGKFVVPEGWCRSVGGMQRSLYKAKNPDWMPRRPRPRVVRPADEGQR